MELRTELLPPLLDDDLVEKLAELAADIDGASPGEWDGWLSDFNRLAGTDIPFEEFKGIYGGEEHCTWVRRFLYWRLIQPASNVTREELLEVIRRAMPQYEYDDYEAYERILDVNTNGAGTRLIDEPPDFDPATNTWGNGRPLSEFDPTPEQIVQWLGY